MWVVCWKSRTTSHPMWNGNNFRLMHKILPGHHVMAEFSDEQEVESS